MELGSVFFVLAVLIVTGIYLYAPFTERIRNNDVHEDHQISALKAERDRVINSLQELDFDFKLGKVPAEDYPEQRTLLLQKGAEVLRQLDESEPIHNNQNVEARIEKAAAKKRADSPSDDSHMSNDEIEALILARRKQTKSKSAGFCSQCGKPVLVTDKFCPSCGNTLS